MAIESAEDTAIGKRFAEDTLKRLAAEAKLTVGEFTWRDDYPGPYITTLQYKVGDSNRAGSIEFRIRQLEDCRNPSNRPARTTMEQQIRDSVQEVSQALART